VLDEAKPRKERERGSEQTDGEHATGEEDSAGGEDVAGSSLGSPLPALLSRSLKHGPLNSSNTLSLQLQQL